MNTISQHGRRKPTAIDLFAGCGGLSQGLRQAGFRVVAAVEIDELAVKSYRMNHPRVRLWNEDIRSVKVSQMREMLGADAHDLDLLAGCPPCQGFSSLRTLNGRRDVRDRRNTLTDEFLRFVRGFKPRAVMLENVPGLVSRKRFQQFRAALQRLGYVVNWTVLDAAKYGVPQRRRRLILVAGKRVRIEFFPADDVETTVRDAIQQLGPPGQTGDPIHQIIGKRSERIAQIIKLIPKDGGSRSELPEDAWLECHKKCEGFFDIYGRMRWDAVAPTITSGCLNPSKGRFLHPAEDRPITAREAALLQTFPSDYRFAVDRGFYAIAAMIGNALPPEFVRRQAVQVAAALKAWRRNRASISSMASRT